MKLALALPLLVAVWLLTGCSDKHSPHDGHDHGAHSDGDGHDHGKATHSKEGQHGEPGAAPGSYEDWCAEHAVPESKCTRCNAGLISTFKANNDWCAEHGLPESQCLKCNPNTKIVRPPKSEGKKK